MIVFFAIWLIVVLLLSLVGVLHSLPIPMPLLGAGLALLLLAALIAWPSWRAKALAGGLKPLVGFHLVRFVGIYFLWLYSLGILPRNFAQPAGWGDIIVAVLAIALLLLPDYRAAGRRLFFILWNILGLLDILMVMAIATRLAIADPGFRNGFASLPLSTLPLFVVPVVVATHALMLMEARRR
jgi:hypothetical protein